MLSVSTPFARPVEDVLAALDSGADGLSARSAAARLDADGPNRLPEPPRPGLVARLLRQFRNVLIYVLLVAGVVTAALREWVDTAVILLVVVLNTLIGLIQEGRAEKALAGIRRMLSTRAQVRRDGTWVRVDADDLVAGDIVRVAGGDRVPADLRLLKARDLRVDEAPLTGESEPVGKSVEPVTADAGIGDRTTMAYSGTLVTAGSGTGVVTATGAATEIGRISTMLAEVEQIETPLTRQMARFGNLLSVVIVTVAVLMMAVGFAVHGDGLGDLAMAAIGFAVAAIPEGLPAILTITLARGVHVMARRRAITRRLDAVETLGAVSVICSDKTGTLTRNEMTVRRLVTPVRVYDVHGTGYQPHGEIRHDGRVMVLGDAPDLDAMVRIAGLVNDATVSPHDDGTWRLAGEPTDGALRTLALKAGFAGTGEERVDEVPFSSDHKYMATLDATRDGDRVILLKGASDRVLALCDTQHTDAPGGPTEPLDRPSWERQIDRLGEEGLRVLAAAYRGAAGLTRLGTDDVDRGGFTLLGLYGIVDPPRPEAVTAIGEVQAAGIRVVMITGDHASTARSIAGEMGIGDRVTVTTGAELERATDDELHDTAAGCDVFARTSPRHKLRLVSALQGRGHVVAMTGDGVNDAPALKRADVGVAMGVKGTEATKEAADIVLADDNFATIRHAVEEGRAIYDNLQKAIVFALPTNGAQSLVVLVAVLLGLTLPITPLQVLWVNMVVAVTLALALAFEPAEPDVMQRMPRDPSGPILERMHVIRVIWVSLLISGVTLGVFWRLHGSGHELSHARTVAVTTLVVAQAFYLLGCRSLLGPGWRRSTLFSNPVAWLTIAVLLLLQLLFVYTPFMHTAFGSTPMASEDWVRPVAAGIGVYAAVELEKAVLRRRRGLRRAIRAA